MRDPALNALIYFDAVARHSLITRAAQELNVSPSAVSQQLKSLEDRFGVHLFRRVKRRLILSEEGERLFEATTQAFGVLSEARSRLMRRQESRRLILRVTPSFGVRWLAPRLASYARLDPDLDVHIDATTDLTDFEIENVDLDIRYGQGHFPGLHSEAFIYDCILPMCSPEYAAQLRRLGCAPEQQLAKARLISTIKADWQWNHWLSLHGFGAAEARGRLLFDRSSMSLQMAIDGVGVVLETATLAMNELAAGQLVPLFPELGAVRFAAYWMICPRSHIHRQPIRKFRDWLQAKAREHEIEKDRLLDELGCARRQITSTQP